MNKNPEQFARDEIDRKLKLSGWVIQNKKNMNLYAGQGVIIREYHTDVGPADYIMFVDQEPVGVIEAKRVEDGQRLRVAEEQSKEYANSKLKYLQFKPLRFVYESTGVLTHFTDYDDPKPRAREVFTFHRPETLSEILRKTQPLRGRLQSIPKLNPDKLRDCQINAITKLEASFKVNKPRALIQMATGSGKTFTAITSIYRLLKYADAKRVLFLVDTKNLGEQAEQEFHSYQPNDDNRKFTELYNVQRLKSNYISTDSQVCISTIQRFYSILKGEELDESAEETNPGENNSMWNKREPLPVVYNELVPIEFFDFIIIDECHRSIYNLWRQVLDYFDGFLIGLTATPDKRTFGFFNQNMVSEYPHELAVADGVNVGHTIFLIETEITKQGAKMKCGEFIDKREKLTRRKRLEQLDEDVAYTALKLDNEVVNPSQIRMIIRTFKDNLPIIFPGRTEVPKTLIFAKTDSHADDIIQIVREEFDEGNSFCKKVTYKADEDPKSVLNQFRNDYNPRIAVTVDMIATGTDVKPLECLIFMRDVKSKNYFEQMKGRGTRTIQLDDLRKVTPSARYTKDHFVIIDAIGVTKSLKTDSRPLDRQPSVSLKDLLRAVTVGAKDEDLFTTLASRLARLEKQLSDQEKEKFNELARGKTINKVVKELLEAYNPDVLEDSARRIYGTEADDIPTISQIQEVQNALIRKAASTFSGELNEYIENVRKIHEQYIDLVNLDTVTALGWDADSKEKVNAIIEDFNIYMEQHKDEITALQIFYNQPHRRKELTFKMLKDLLEKLRLDKPGLAPISIWQAYEQLDQVGQSTPKNELIALVALIRRVVGIDQKLTSFDKTVDKNFQDWVFKKQAGSLKYNSEQMEWLRMMKDHIVTSFHIEKEDIDYSPFDAQGGQGKMWQLFGEQMDIIIEELNEGLVA
ncbi:type I restriction enzyme, R subunit [Paenibacillus algorifonticola]|uniref:Type I restriction enzyme, R subunit n=1 Tax=Paenibacillus algorifonticola TaxID=684063 RepID=A0A1I2J4V1_9BACL|nr:DEAD/DEAH box helicase family protein [Paenibacillus algorifonticola]SFF49735.1 type I restriction enzyme, R subunit [Paenibacillus algorifonticola]